MLKYHNNFKFKNLVNSVKYINNLHNFHTIKNSIFFNSKYVNSIFNKRFIIFT